jgi:large conductance mechanosensitive channel
MGMLKEFREFAVRGQAVDLAVAVIIGGAFGKIISSLVSDIIMPPIGKLLGNVNFGDLFVSLDKAKTAGVDSLAKARETGAAVIAYGQFINVVIDFVIVAACIFGMVKVISVLKRAPPPPAPDVKECPFCCSKIAVKATRCPNCTSQLQGAA